MTSSDWNSDNVYLKCSNFRVYIVSRILIDFVKLKQNFLLNGIRENKYTLNMHKMYISRNTKKIRTKLIQLNF